MIEHCYKAPFWKQVQLWPIDRRFKIEEKVE